MQGEPVLFGSQLQLRHDISGQYLTIANTRAAMNKTALKAMLGRQFAG
jgi:hypothetical protein